MKYNYFLKYANRNPQQEEPKKIGTWDYVTNYADDDLSYGVGHMLSGIADMTERATRPDNMTPQEWREHQSGLLKNFTTGARALGEKFQEGNDVPELEDGSVPYHLRNIIRSLPESVATMVVATALGSPIGGAVGGLGRLAGGAVLNSAKARNILFGLQKAYQAPTTAGKIARTIIPTDARTIASAGIGAGLEANSERQQAINELVDEAKRNGTYVQGQTELEAERKTPGVFSKNFGIISAFNVPQYGMFFGKPVARSLAGKAGRLALAGNLEGLEEVGQELVRATELDKPIEYRNLRDAYVAGAGMGVGMHGAGRAANYLANRGLPSEEEVEKARREIGRKKSADTSSLYGNFRQETQSILSQNKGDAELRSWADKISGGQMSDGVFNSIVRNAQEFGIDPKLALAQATAESEGRQGVTSPAGAIGVMQLMPETARELGVDPYDTEDNIRGGMKYLRQMYDKFGDWNLALAAYNAGPGAVTDHIPQNGETENYVARINGFLDNSPKYKSGKDIFGAENYNMPTQGERITQQVSQLKDGWSQVIPQIGGVLRDKFKINAAISSAARSAEHNADVGGVPNSYHVIRDGGGDALDIVFDRETSQEEQEQIAEYFRNTGLFSEVLYHDVGSGAHLHLGGLKTENLKRNEQQGVPSLPQWNDYVRETNAPKQKKSSDKPFSTGTEDEITQKILNDAIRSEQANNDIANNGDEANNVFNGAFGDSLPVTKNTEAILNSIVNAPVQNQIQQEPKPQSDTKQKEAVDRNVAVIRAAQAHLNDLLKSNVEGDKVTAWKLNNAIQAGNIAEAENILKQNNVEIPEPQSVKEEPKKQQPDKLEQEPLKENRLPENILPQATPAQNGAQTQLTPDAQRLLNSLLGISEANEGAQPAIPDSSKKQQTTPMSPWENMISFNSNQRPQTEGQLEEQKRRADELAKRRQAEEEERARVAKQNKELEELRARQAEEQRLRQESEAESQRQKSAREIQHRNANISEAFGISLEDINAQKNIDLAMSEATADNGKNKKIGAELLRLLNHRNAQPETDKIKGYAGLQKGLVNGSKKAIRKAQDVVNSIVDSYANSIAVESSEGGEQTLTPEQLARQREQRKAMRQFEREQAARIEEDDVADEIQFEDELFEGNAFAIEGSGEKEDRQIATDEIAQSYLDEALAEPSEDPKARVKQGQAILKLLKSSELQIANEKIDKLAGLKKGLKNGYTKAIRRAQSIIDDSLKGDQSLYDNARRQEETRRSQQPQAQPQPQVQEQPQPQEQPQIQARQQETSQPLVQPQQQAQSQIPTEGIAGNSELAWLAQPFWASSKKETTSEEQSQEIPPQQTQEQPRPQDNEQTPQRPVIQETTPESVPEQPQTQAQEPAKQEQPLREKTGTQEKMQQSLVAPEKSPNVKIYKPSSKGMTIANAMDDIFLAPVGTELGIPHESDSGIHTFSISDNGYGFKVITDNAVRGARPELLNRKNIKKFFGNAHEIRIAFPEGYEQPPRPKKTTKHSKKWHDLHSAYKTATHPLIGKHLDKQFELAASKEDSLERRDAIEKIKMYEKRLPTDEHLDRIEENIKRNSELEVAQEPPSHPTQPAESEPAKEAEVEEPAIEDVADKRKPQEETNPNISPEMAKRIEDDENSPLRKTLDKLWAQSLHSKLKTDKHPYLKELIDGLIKTASQENSPYARNDAQRQLEAYEQANLSDKQLSDLERSLEDINSAKAPEIPPPVWEPPLRDIAGMGQLSSRAIERLKVGDNKYIELTYVAKDKTYPVVRIPRIDLKAAEIKVPTIRDRLGGSETFASYEHSFKDYENAKKFAEEIHDLYYRNNPDLVKTAETASPVKGINPESRKPSTTDESGLTKEEISNEQGEPREGTQEVEPLAPEEALRQAGIKNPAYKGRFAAIISSGEQIDPTKYSGKWFAFINNDIRDSDGYPRHGESYWRHVRSNSGILDKISGKIDKVLELYGGKRLDAISNNDSFVFDDRKSAEGFARALNRYFGNKESESTSSQETAEQSEPAPQKKTTKKSKPSNREALHAKLKTDTHPTLKRWVDDAVEAASKPENDLTRDYLKSILERDLNDQALDNAEEKLKRALDRREKAKNHILNNKLMSEEQKQKAVVAYLGTGVPTLSFLHPSEKYYDLQKKISQMSNEYLQFEAEKWLSHFDMGEYYEQESVTAIEDLIRRDEAAKQQAQTESPKETTAKAEPEQDKKIIDDAKEEAYKILETDKFPSAKGWLDYQIEKALRNKKFTTAEDLAEKIVSTVKSLKDSPQFARAIIASRFGDWFVEQGVDRINGALDLGKRASEKNKKGKELFEQLVREVKDGEKTLEEAYAEFDRFFSSDKKKAQKKSSEETKTTSKPKETAKSEPKPEKSEPTQQEHTAEEWGEWRKEQDLAVDLTDKNLEVTDTLKDKFYKKFPNIKEALDVILDLANSKLTYSKRDALRAGARKALADWIIFAANRKLEGKAISSDDMLISAAVRMLELWKTKNIYPKGKRASQKSTKINEKANEIVAAYGNKKISAQEAYQQIGKMLYPQYFTDSNQNTTSKLSLRGDGDTTIANFIAPEDLTPQQKLIQSFGEKLGVKTTFFRNNNADFHGAHAGNTSYINVNSEMPLGQVFWHESMHWLKNNNPKLYQQLVKAAGITDEQRQAYLKDIKRKDLKTDAAIDNEIIADQFEDVAKRNGLLQSIADKNRGLIERVVQWLKDTMNKFIEFFHNPQGKLTTKQKQALADEFGEIATRLVDPNGERIFRYNRRTGNLETIGGRSMAKATPLNEAGEIEYSVGNSNNSSESLTQKIRNAFSSWWKGGAKKNRNREITDLLYRVTGYKVDFGNVKDADKTIIDDVHKVIRAKHAYEWDKLLPQIGGKIAKSLKLNPTEEMSNYIADWCMTGAVGNQSAEAKAFEKAMRNDPVTAGLMLQIRESFQEFNDMTAEQKIGSTIVSRLQGKSPREIARTLWSDKEEEISDDLHPVLRQINDMIAKAEKTSPTLAKLMKEDITPYQMMRLLRGIGGLGNLMIGTEKVKDIEDVRDQFRAIYPRLKFDRLVTLDMIVDMAGGKKHVDGLMKYAVAKLDKEMHEKLREDPDADIRPQFSEAVDDEVIKNGEKQYAQAHRSLVTYSNILLCIQHDAGLIGDRAFTKAIKGWKNYIPMIRVFEEGEDFKFEDSLKHKTGSQRSTYNPMETLTQNTYDILSRAERNKAKQQLAFYARIGEFGDIIQEVETSNPGNNVITFREGGKIKYLKVFDPAVKRAVDNIYSPADTSWIMKFLRATMNIVRNMRTMGSPDFAIGNPFRDMQDAYIHNRHADVNPLKALLDVFREGFKGFGFKRMFREKSLVPHDTDWAEFNALGGTQSTFVSEDVDQLRRSMNKLTRKTFKEQFFEAPFRTVLDRMQWLSEQTEYMTRLNSYKRAKAELAKQHGGKATLEDKRLAALEARDASIDFAKSGNSTRKINQLLMFANAQVQDWAKWGVIGRDLAKGGEARKIATQKIGRMILSRMVPVLLFAALNRSDDDRKEKYKKRPDWEKETYWIFGDGVRIPKGQDVAGRFVSALTDEFIDKALDDDPVSTKRLLKVIRDAVPSIIPSLIEPAYEVRMNYSAFRDAPIVPVGQQRLAVEEQYGRYTSSFAKLFSEMTGLTSPRGVDYLINNYFGSTGRFVTQAPDYLFGRGMTLNDALMVRRFVFDPAENTKTVKEYYEAYDEQYKHYNTYKLRRKWDKNAKPHEDFDPKLFTKLKSAQDSLQNISKKENEILRNPKLDWDAKNKKIRELEKKREKICEKIMQRAR